ncbi:MAG: polysaccharide biosynthesis C-terminal domain-containing protein [Bacteroidetes bacterium]|nr:polysaccharide biosynthesis C-terminal domain-containing protein [Candidatus Colenecus caballi]
MGVVIRQSLKGAILTYIGAAIGFVTQFFIVTRFLNPDIIGLTKVFYEVGNFFASFALLGVTASGMRFFPYFRDPEKGNNGFLFWYLMIPLIGTALISGIYCLCKTPVIDFFAKDSALFVDYFYLVIPLILILTLWQAFENYSNINMRIALPKGVREVGLRIFTLASYLLYAFGYIGISGLVLAILFSYGLCLLIDVIYVSKTQCISLKHDSKFISPDLRRSFFKYSGFLILAAISHNLMNQLDIFMLSGVKGQGLYSVGIYTIALYMANVIDMPARSIQAISTPIAADALKRDDFETANSLYKKVSINQLIISSLILLVIWVNLDNIYAIIPNGETFSKGRYVVLFLGLSKIIVSTLNFGSIMIQFSKYYFWSLYIAIFITILSIGTNLFFIPRMGVAGAALATLIATIISYSYQQYLVHKKVHGNPFTWKTVWMILVAIGLWGLNFLIPSVTHISPWLDIAIRCLVIGTAGLFLIYKLNISPDVNLILDKFLKKKQ